MLTTYNNFILYCIVVQMHCSLFRIVVIIYSCRYFMFAVFFLRDLILIDIFIGKPIGRLWNGYENLI